MAFLGQESIDAANAAFCAREVGGDEGYFKMHDLLFAKQQGENDGTYSKDNLKKYAAEAGFTTQLDSCIDSGKFNSQVTTSTSQANAAGIQGTPAFMVNGKQASPEYTTLKATIDAALAG
jgi:protein-disulfide isomerase